jgi:fluoroquinolone resistance protein
MSQMTRSLAVSKGADLRKADLGGMKLVDIRLFQGATVSCNQAADHLGELGLSVA